MGYTTDFTGRFNLDRPLTVAHLNYLKKFNETRRMKRNVALLAYMPDPVRLAAELLLGPDGAYFVGGTGMLGQDHDASIIDFNQEPTGQPGLWCQWMPTEDGTGIEWDEGEKFYDYMPWLEYLIKHFLMPWGYVLNGEVKWQGEDSDDRGVILVKDNQVSALNQEQKTANVKELLEEALATDGAHHKQWYLWRIADALGLEMPDGWASSGIAP